MTFFLAARPHFVCLFTLRSARSTVLNPFLESFFLLDHIIEGKKKTDENGSVEPTSIVNLCIQFAGFEQN